MLYTRDMRRPRDSALVRPLPQPLPDVAQQRMAVATAARLHYDADVRYAARQALAAAVVADRARRVVSDYAADLVGLGDDWRDAVVATLAAALDEVRKS